MYEWRVHERLDRNGIARRRTDAGEPGNRKVRAVPREHWTWAADGRGEPMHTRPRTG